MESKPHHCSSYWRRREILVVVKVAQLRDGETVESGGQPRECDFDRSYDRAVRLKKYRVFAERHNAVHGKPSGNFEKTFVWLQMANEAIPHLLYRREAALRGTRTKAPL
jgi:hypothetical protein